MKNLFFIAFGIIFTSCEPNHSETPDTIAPEISIHSPQPTNMPAPDSEVNIVAHITDDKEIHNVNVHITATTNPDTMLIMNIEHIHSDVFHLDTTFTANIHLGVMSDYTLTIEAEDTSNNIFSESVTFHVMNM